MGGILKDVDVTYVAEDGIYRLLGGNLGTDDNPLQIIELSKDGRRIAAFENGQLVLPCRDYIKAYKAPEDSAGRPIFALPSPTMFLADSCPKDVAKLDEIIPRLLEQVPESQYTAISAALIKHGGEY